MTRDPVRPKGSIASALKKGTSGWAKKIFLQNLSSCDPR